VGDKLPTTPLYEGSPANKVNLAELVGNKKGVVFAVPGAFTPGCSKVRLLIFLHVVTVTDKPSCTAVAEFTVDQFRHRTAACSDN